MFKKLLFLCFFLIGFSFRAQNFVPYYYHFTKQNGLPTETVYDIYQDKKGFIWISTEQGLYKYDGKNYISYTLDEQTSKSGSGITEDIFGRIWYSNFDGYIYYVENGKLKLFKPHIPVGYLKFAIINNSLFTIEDSGLVIYNVRNGKKLKTISVNLKKLNSTHTDAKNFYIFADELLIVNEKNVRRIPLPEKLKNFKAGLIQNTKNGLLLTSKYEKVGVFFDNKSFKTIDFPNEITFIQNSSFDGAENWLCTTDGAFRVGDNRQYFKGFNISNVFRGKDGGFWFTTINNGIFLVPNLDVRFFENDKVIISISQANNNLLIGTQNEELYLKNLENNNSKLLYKGQNKHEIYLLKTFGNIPRIFLSSYGFRVLDFQGKTIYESEAAIKDIVPLDENSYAFAASGSCGILQLGASKNNWKKIFPVVSEYEKQLFLLNKVRGKSVAYNNQTKALYFATNKGLYLFKDYKNQEIKYNGKSIYITRLVSFGNQVLGLTQNNFLVEIDGNQVKKTSFNQYIKNYRILKIKLQNEHLYLNTDNGIFVYDFINKNFYKKLSYNQEFEFSQITEVKDKVYIAVNRGVLALSIVYQEKQSTPKLIIDEVKMNGENFDYQQPISFDNEKNNLELHYALLNFTPGEKYKIFYKINNGVWHLADEDSRKLELPSLASGEYEILLKTENEKAKPISVKFAIEQVFWKSWWFILLMGALTVALIVIYYKAQIRKINYTKQLEIDRIQLEKESNSSKLKAFKSQMNPHFFYNALNTLQSYILTNDKKPALHYLSQFSGLTRKILEYTEQDNISISEEVETLKLYLELEKARFSDDLDYQISLKNIENPQHIFIPVMLLQPYVENALKHGLLHSKKGKKLWISFEQKAQFLEILIEDNGIGIEKSKIINAQKGNQKPTSFATSAQEKRVEILNKMYHNDVEIFIEDRKYGSAISDGTVVKIKLKPMTIR